MDLINKSKAQSATKSQIFKPERFFVENKGEKTMYLLRKTELVFNKIANAIEFQNRLEIRDNFKKERAKNQRETRIAKRTYFYEFYLFEDDYDYKKVEKSAASCGNNLKKNDFILSNDQTGLFKGSEVDLIAFLDSLYS